MDSITWGYRGRLKAGLSPHFALEANLKNPTTFQALVQTCQAYNRQIKVLQAGADSTVAAIGGNLLASPILKQSSILHGGQVFPNVFMTSPTTYQTNAPVIQETIPPKLDGDFSEQLNRRLDEVTRQIQQMQANFNVSQTRDAPRERRVIVCYTCGVEGHISTRCPSRRQGGWGRGMHQPQSNQNNNTNQLNTQVAGEENIAAQIPTIPPNVNLLDIMYDTDEECDVAPIKRTRESQKNKAVEGETSNSQQKKKAKETNLEGEPRKKHSRRKIKIDDMPMGKGVELFDLNQELISSGPRITWPQLLQLSPSLRKEWGRLSSIRKSIRTLHYAGVVQVKDRKDI